MFPSREGRPGRWRAYGALTAGLVAMAACAGENLFSAAGTTGGVAPVVNITSPTEGSTLGAGSSIQIRAEVSAPSGLATADYRGNFVDGGAAAFVQESESFPARPVIATLVNTLSATGGGGTGAVRIVVRVTDGAGMTKADTVQITID